LKARGFTAVMASRRSPPRALDYFPTPPWATRAGAALVRELDPMAADNRILICEPACGGGHMSHVLADNFGNTSVFASDVFDYDWGHSVQDFLSPEWDGFWDPDWIVTNPPFSIAPQFALLALERARRGVALLLRSAFSEGAERYRTLFQPYPPVIEAQFCERVPMVAGCWDPKASSATAYSWFIWTKDDGFGIRLGQGRTERRWIAPGAREAFTMPDDVRRFAPTAPAPLFDEVPTP